MKRWISLCLALVMTLGLMGQVAAAQPAFRDMPEGHWAYEAVETVADKGLMKGTGDGLFSPEMKVSVAQFLTLVGRVVFPDVTADGEDWAGPYIAAAKERGLLKFGSRYSNEPEALEITDVEAEISRYDMSVILYNAVLRLGAKSTYANKDAIADFDKIELYCYQNTVEASYGSGLIVGDETGAFNGDNTMTRAEVAVVVGRLMAMKEQIVEEYQERQRRDEELAAYVESEEFKATRTGTYKTFRAWSTGGHYYSAGIPIGFYYKDGRLLGQTVTDSDGEWYMDVTVDEADYSTTDKCYYAAVIGATLGEYNGNDGYLICEPKEFSSWFLESLSENRDSVSGFRTHDETIKVENSGNVNWDYWKGKAQAVVDEAARQKQEEVRQMEEWYKSSRTGETVTVEIRFAGLHFYGHYDGVTASNATYGLFYKDGRLLAQVTTDEKGDAKPVKVTMDKADWRPDEYCYYVQMLTDEAVNWWNYSMGVGTVVVPNEQPALGCISKERKLVSALTGEFEEWYEMKKDTRDGYKSGSATKDASGHVYRDENGGYTSEKPQKLQ